MKILQICPIFPQPSDISSGVVNVVYNISKELVKRGHEVSIYTSTAYSQNNLKNQIVIDGIKVYYFPYIFSNYTFSITPSIIPYLKKHINDFDIVHIHEHRTFQSIIAGHYAQKNAIPYIIQAHGSADQNIGSLYFKKIFDLLIGYKLLKNSFIAIALTETEAGTYNKMGLTKENIKIIPNGININKYQNKSFNFREKYNLDKNTKVVLYLGRLDKNKGIDLLIKSFAVVSNKINNVKLVIVGPDDGFLDFLEELTKTLNLEEKVLFTGPLYGNEKAEAYIGADIFVTPSYSGFPITFLESCTYGIPIITTSKGDKLEWIDNNVGYVVKYDKNKLSDVILKILSHDNLRNKFGQNGRNLVKSKFNWQSITKDIEKTYSED
jgi:glycosyltransferase involved in cell wall biosynthesis